VEGVECVRRDVCAYKERNLVGLEVPPVEEAKAAPGPGSWAVVVEAEEASCILLLQLFWIAAPVRRNKKGVGVSRVLSSDGGRERNAVHV